MSPTQRKLISKRMKQYWANRRALRVEVNETHTTAPCLNEAIVYLRGRINELESTLRTLESEAN